MAESIAIAVSGVSKCYRVFENRRARLLHALQPKYQHGVSEIWALRDVDIEVKRGESVGIIGRNGSGKSTLLEIIAGTSTPTRGEVAVAGRVAPLLELGSGFNLEHSGRENVYINGLLLGLDKARIEQRFDEIAAFADIGEFIDRPVKTYSSGMLVRLAFAVQVALDPDILIVDEALSVGDYFFQQKCFIRLRKMRDDGLTLLFVSHDMGMVRDICDRALYLKAGEARFFGPTRQAISAYLRDGRQNQIAAQALPSAAAALSPAMLKAITIDAIWSRPPGEESYLLAVRLLDQNDCCTTQVKLGESIRLLVYHKPHPDPGAFMTLVVENRYGQTVTSTNSKKLGIGLNNSTDIAFALFEFGIECLLEAGQYTLIVNFGLDAGPNRGTKLDATEPFGPITVAWDYELDEAPFLGLFGLPISGKVIGDERMNP